MAHLSDHAALLGRSAAGPAGLVFCVRFRLAPARAPRQLLIRYLFGLLIGYRHEAVVHPHRRLAVVGKSAETRSVLPALQERVVLGSFLAGAIAGPASYQGRADDHGAIALGPPDLAPALLIVSAARVLATSTAAITMHRGRRVTVLPYLVGAPLF